MVETGWTNKLLKPQLLSTVPDTYTHRIKICWVNKWNKQFLSNSFKKFFFFLSFFFFKGLTHGIWKFSCHELNPSWGCDLCSSCINARSFKPLHQAEDWIHTSSVTWAASVRFLTHCTTLGIPILSSFQFFLKNFTSRLLKIFYILL